MADADELPGTSTGVVTEVRRVVDGSGGGRSVRIVVCLVMVTTSLLGTVTVDPESVLVIMSPVIVDSSVTTVSGGSIPEDVILLRYGVMSELSALVLDVEGEPSRSDDSESSVGRGHRVT